jgi:SAM-dependent methyltransferase
MPFSSSAYIYDEIYTEIRDYERQAEQIHGWIRMRKHDAKKLLDVACGTGFHLSYLRSWYEVEGVDISSAMVNIAQLRNKNIPIHLGDMRDFNLQARFDVIICLFSSITYANTIKDLNAVLANFARHLEPGGICIIEPYITPQRWRDGLLGLRTAESKERKIAMVDRAKRDERWVTREIGYVVATPHEIRHINETHSFMLYSSLEYENAYRKAGFTVEFDMRGFDDDRGMYIGVLSK